MPKLTVSVDRNADLKALRRLEAAGLVELFAVAIEGIEDTKRLQNKELPIAVIGSPFALIGQSSVAADDTSYPLIEKIVGRQHHGDCLHLERHIASKRDFFVTDDNDFLSCRAELAEAFGISIVTVAELAAHFSKTQE